MHWTQTISGRKIDLLNLKPEDVNFKDVAHNLSHVNRFCGATARPYSVAEHCVRIYDALRAVGHSPLVCFVGLLHDAHEAYMGDVITPVKNALCTLAQRAGTHPAYVEDALKELKRGLDMAIFEAAGLDLNDPSVVGALVGPVKDMDASAMMGERDAIMAPPPEPWPGGLEELTRMPISRHAGWRSDAAAREWLDRFYLHAALDPAA